MDQSEILIKIEELLSPKKIDSYKSKFSDEWFEVYKIELNQAKEMFIRLHFLEIFLRDKIYAEFHTDFGDWLFDIKSPLKLNFREREKLNKSLVELEKLGKEINSDNIISNLNFGFWTNLFHKYYNYSVWQQNKMVERVFPFLTHKQRDLKKLQNQMEAIRKFRNRIFHFENLQGWNFEEMKKLVDSFIYGIGGIKIEKILELKPQ